MISPRNLLLCAAVLLVPVAYGARQLEAINFNPPTLTVTDATLNTVFTVKLNKGKPKHPVYIYWEAPLMKFTDCRLKIEPDENWDKPRDISAVAIPFMKESDADRKLEAKVRLFSKDPNYQTTSIYPIVRTKLAGAGCLVHGDPHIASFDNDNYDFHLDGTFYLLKTKLLTVQGQTGLFSNGFRVIRDVIVRFGTTVLSFSAYSEMREPQQASEKMTGVEIGKSPAGRAEITLKFVDGSSVKITAFRDDPTYKYLNIAITVPPYAAADAGGICGNKSGNKWISRDGKKIDAKTPPANFGAALAGYGTPIMNDWAKSWEVPKEENLFLLCRVPEGAADDADSVCSYPKETEVMPFKDTHLCRIPDDENDPGIRREVLGIYDEVKNCPKMKRVELISNYTEKVTTQTIAIVVSEKFKTECQMTCKEAIQIDKLNAVLDSEKYVTSCQTDCIASGKLHYVEGTKSAYLTGCQKIIEPQLEETEKELAKAARDIAKNFGFGDFTCQNCGENGKCTANGCGCNDGWTGLKCDVRAAKTDKKVEEKLKKEAEVVQKIQADAEILFQKDIEKNERIAVKVGEKENVKVTESHVQQTIEVDRNGRTRKSTTEVNLDDDVADYFRV